MLALLGMIMPAFGLVVPASTEMAARVRVSHILVDSEEMAQTAISMIKDGNTASERVFSKVGFVRENPNAKKGSGRRRANRKWIYSPISDPAE